MTEILSTLALVLVLNLIVALNFQAVLRIFGTGAILAAVLFSVLSALMGWSLGGRQTARRTVLGLGTGLRNVPAALIVSVQNFKDPHVAVMVLVTTLTGILILLPIAKLVGRHEPATDPENQTTRP